MPARPALTPQIRFLYIGSRVCPTLLSDPASRRRPCASLSLHLHQVVRRTFTFELLNMLGTHKPAQPGAAVPHNISDLNSRRRNMLACSAVVYARCLTLILLSG